MSRAFKTVNKYYGEHYNLYIKERIVIEEGITVLVGCNGSGKTTLLRQMHEQLKENKIPVLHFDNLTNGGSHSMQSAAYWGDLVFASTAMASSEGENIVLNIARLASQIGAFVRTGEYLTRSEKILKAISNTSPTSVNAEPPCLERWILLDAIDSGLSIDNVIEIKEHLFKTILKDSNNYKIYIVVVANGFEMCRNEQCFDVYNGDYIKFKNYEEYRAFILNSKKAKEKCEN